MNKTDYLSLRKAIVREGLATPAPLYGILAICFESALFVALFFALSLIETFSALFWLIQLTIGLSMFRSFALLHECGHRAMFRSKNLNTLAGLYTSLFCLMPYTPWRDLHKLHHKWVGVIDKDPTQKDLVKLKSASLAKRNLFRFVWFLCLPVPSMQLVTSVFWLNPMQKLIEGDFKEAFKGLACLMLCLLPHILALFFLGGKTYLTYILPSVVFYFFWFEAINFTHHSGLFPYDSSSHPEPIPLNEQDAVSRTSAFSRIVSTAFSYNFNFHTEHHYFPTVPWHNLPRVYELVQKIPDNNDYKDVDFLGFAFKLRKQDPVNVYINSQLKPIEQEQ